MALVLAIATAGLVYELGMAAVASYVLGDSVRQFSIVIGAYLSALGLGAYLSRFVERRLVTTFVNVELAAALIGGLSSPGLFVAFSLGASFQILLIAVVVSVGVLVGLELPLLMRILETKLSFKDLVARALTYDYAGALVGSLGFTLYLVPTFGLVRTSILCGMLNASVALVATWVLVADTQSERQALAFARWSALMVIAALFATLYFAPNLVASSEARTYGKVLFTKDTPYQRILLTERDGAFELYLNGHLQFSARDECRYHEALVHPAFLTVAKPRTVLIGGGGDGLALREVLKWPSVEHVLLIDLDPAMTALAHDHPRLRALNHRSLLDSRVVVRNEDAFQWVSKDTGTYDVIILDFPDPTTYGVGKLFSTMFYSKLKQRLSPDGTVVVQATSPFLTPKSYWSIERTIASVGYDTQALRVYLPSFGDWGFVLARLQPLRAVGSLPDSVRLRCLDGDALSRLMEFPKDALLAGGTINDLANQSLVHTYLDEAKRLD